jgi:hypothetical protein
LAVIAVDNNCSGAKPYNLLFSPLEQPGTRENQREKISSSKIAFLICTISTAWGQTPATSPQLQASAVTPDCSLSLDIVVTDKSGNPVSGLLEQDFTLLDDKQPKPILSFRATTIH